MAFALAMMEQDGAGGAAFAGMALPGQAASLRAAGRGILSGRPSSAARLSQGRRGSPAASQAFMPDGDEAFALLLHQQEAMYCHRPGGPGFVVAPAQPDVDNMSYEELLALGERIGYAEKPDRPEVNRLPTRCICEGEAVEEECAVCYEDYKAGDVVKTLPCLHFFHAPCIDKWMSSNHPGSMNCPVCNTRVEF